MWKQGTTNGYDWQAKVYESGSQYGTNGGPVSKLWIDGVYEYDRGLSFDEAPAGLVDAVIRDIMNP